MLNIGFHQKRTAFPRQNLFRREAPPRAGTRNSYLRPFLRAGRISRVFLRNVSERNRHQRVQKLRGPHAHRTFAGHHGDRRTERLRKIEHRRRDSLGARRTEREGAARRLDARRHFLGNGQTQTAALLRSRTRLRGLRKGTRHRVQRGFRHAPRFAGRRLGLFSQRQSLPPQGHPAPVHGHGHRPRLLLVHGAGANRPDSLRQSRGTPHAFRGSRRHHALQGATQGSARETRARRPEPRPHHRRRRGSFAAHGLAEAAGGEGAALPPRAAPTAPPRPGVARASVRRTRRRRGRTRSARGNAARDRRRRARRVAGTRRKARVRESRTRGTFQKNRTRHADGVRPAIGKGKRRSADPHGGSPTERPAGAHRASRTGMRRARRTTRRTRSATPRRRFGQAASRRDSPSSTAPSRRNGRRC